MAQETYYDVLGLDYLDCDIDDVKKAYRKLALQYHPDRVPPEKQEEATAKFLAITEAYETLSNGPKRLRYDTEMGLSRRRNRARQKTPPRSHPRTPPRAAPQEAPTFNFQEEETGNIKTGGGQRMGGRRKVYENKIDVADEPGNYYNKNRVGGKKRLNFSVKPKKGATIRETLDVHFERAKETIDVQLERAKRIARKNNIF